MASKSDTFNNTPQLSTSILASGFLQCFLQGIIVAQASKYWKTGWPRDGIIIRAYVLLVICLSFPQTILEDYKVWRVAIMNQPWPTSPLLWTEFFLNGLIVALCSAYLIRRSWKVTGKKPWVIWSLALFSLSLLTANIITSAAIRQGQVAKDDYIRKQLRWAFITFYYWTYGTLALDIGLTIILIAYLWRSRTGLASSDKVLMHIGNIAWETALLPAISMLIAVGLYHTETSVANSLVSLFFVLSGKLYTNGLMRMLNTRSAHREVLRSGRVGCTTMAASSEMTNTTWTEITDMTCSPIGSVVSGVRPLTPVTLLVSTSPSDREDEPRLTFRDMLDTQHMDDEEKGLRSSMGEPSVASGKN